MSYMRLRATRALVALLLVAAATGALGGRGLLQDAPEAAAAAPDGGYDPSLSALSEDQAVESAKKIVGALQDAAKVLPKNFTLIPRNMTWKLPENVTIKDMLSNITLENGMTALEFAKAFMTGTISANTADTNTPDRGLSDVQSGALNINPFVDGAAMSNALTLAGRDATSNSRGIVFGLVGTGRSSNEATALGMSGASASTDTFVINGGGLNQNAMGSNLAFTPHGASDTSVRSAAFNIIGGTFTGGLTNAVGKKGGESAGLGASMTGLGDSYSSQFANSLSEGDTSSNTGVIAGSLTGTTKGTVGSVATSAKRSADTQALSTSKSAIGSATSKSASMSTAAQNATSHSGANSFSGVGNTASISSTTAMGLNADAAANSNATSEAGAANSIAISKASGVNSASASSNATSRPSSTGIRRAPVLATQLRLPSVTLSSSKSSSTTAQGPGGRVGLLPDLLPNLPRPNFINKPTPESASLPTTAPLLGEALITNVGLKALLPSVPKIIPQLPTLNQTIDVKAAPPCNETEINANRTADQKWLTCNATANSSAAEAPSSGPNLPGLSFFDNLRKMNDDFVKENSKSSPSPSPSPSSPKPKPKPASSPKPGSGSGGGGSGGGGAQAAAAPKKPGGVPSGAANGGGTGGKAPSPVQPSSAMRLPASSPKPSPKPGAGAQGSPKQSPKQSPKPAMAPGGGSGATSKPTVSPKPTQ